MLRKIILITSYLMASNAYAISVTSGVAGNTLATSVVGTGVTVSNVIYTGAANASGTFTNGTSSGLGFDSGIILTTGNAADAVGPNSDTETSTENDVTGYAPLDTLAGATTRDATVLSFDFEINGGAGGDLFFSYIFASEEYNEFVNEGFNDVFGFFLDGTNVALLPDNSPVSIDTVNLGSNSALFNDNEAGAFDLEYDGFTAELLVSALGLSAGNHTISFAIADVGDYVLDTAVFLKGDSFSNMAPVPLPASILFLFSGVGMLGWFKRSKSS